MLIIFSNGNDGQVNFYLHLLKSIKNNIMQETSIVFASEDMGSDNIKLLQSLDVKFHLIDKEYVNSLNSKLKSNTHPLGKIAKPFLIKHYLDSSKHEEVDHFLYLDPDILIQDSLDEIINMAGENTICYARQHDFLTTNKNLVQRFARSGYKLENFDLRYEINTGFFHGRIGAIKMIVDDWCNFMLDEQYLKFKDHDKDHSRQLNAWHDQDYFRLFIRIHTSNAYKLKILEPNIAAHLCDSLIFKMKARQKGLFSKVTENYSPIIHFAGGSYKYYYRYSKLYGRLNEYYKHYFFGIFIEKLKGIIKKIIY